MKLLWALCPGNCASSSKQISRPWSSKRLRYMRFTIGVTKIAICTPPKLNPEAENDVWIWLSKLCFELLRADFQVNDVNFQWPGVHKRSFLLLGVSYCIPVTQSVDFWPCTLTPGRWRWVPAQSLFAKCQPTQSDIFSVSWLWIFLSKSLKPSEETSVLNGLASQNLMAPRFQSSTYPPQN